MIADLQPGEVVTPYAELPLGTEDDGAISCLTAKSYRSYINHHIRPRWEKYLINGFAKPQIRSAMETWLAGLCAPGKLAPKTARNIAVLLTVGNLIGDGTLRPQGMWVRSLRKP